MSLFTHMLPEGLERYMSEFVLKNGGRAFMTFYLLNDESLRAIETGNRMRSFDSSIRSEAVA